MVGIPGFSGTLIRPHDAGFDAARGIWNAMHDRRPALIARPRSAKDVAAAIRYARAEGLLIAVRGGGHSMPGHSVCDDGMVIDLRALSHVNVDPRRKRATVGGGALLGDVDRATQMYGLVVPAGVVSHTGAGGLTLGGGVGRLMRGHLARCRRRRARDRLGPRHLHRRQAVPDRRNLRQLHGRRR
jgi:FAD/FMN-containing dehydrogenase